MADEKDSKAESDQTRGQDKVDSVSSVEPTDEELRKLAQDKRLMDENKKVRISLRETQDELKSLKSELAQLRESPPTAKNESATAALEREISDLKKKVHAESERAGQERQRADRNTIEAKLHSVLSEMDVPDIKTAIRHLQSDVRVDDDGKVAIRDADGEWGSLTTEAASKILPAILQRARGAGGSGTKGSRVEVRGDGDIVSNGLDSQADFNKNFPEIMQKLRDGQRSAR